MGARRIAITGARGYVGEAIARVASARGHEVIALSRSPAAASDERRYELAAPIEDRLLEDIDVVVHCAYDLKANRERDIRRINVEGTRRLLEASAAAGAQFLLISSMSAYAGTRQLYGRAKLASEADALRGGGNVVRLGLVHGADGGGMIGSLTRLAGLPVIPLIGARSHQFMVEVGEMAEAVGRLLEHPEIRGELAGLAYPAPVPFAALIRALARGRGGRAPVLVPVPWQPLYAAMRAVEATGASLPLRADSILGLVRPAPSVPNVELWERLGAPLHAPALDGLAGR